MQAEDGSDEEQSVIEISPPRPLKNVKIEGVLPSRKVGDVGEFGNIINQHISTQTKDDIEILKKKIKSKRKKRKSKRGTKDPVDMDDQDQEEKARIREQLLQLDPLKPSSQPDASFYKAPKNLEKRRCYTHKNAKALKCTVCDGGTLHLIPMKFSHIFLVQCTTEPGGPSSPTYAFWQMLIWDL